MDWVAIMEWGDFLMTSLAVSLGYFVVTSLLQAPIQVVADVFPTKE